MEQQDLSKVNPQELEAQPQTITLDTLIEAISPAEEAFEVQLRKLGWNDDDVHHACYAYREFLVNAIVHGNIKLDMDLVRQEVKKKWGSDFREELVSPEMYEQASQAQRKPEVQERKVRVDFPVFSQHHVVVEIQDQGGPSNFSINELSLEQATKYSEEELMANSGRGIKTALLYVKRIGQGKSTARSENNEQGTKIILDLKI